MKKQLFLHLIFYCCLQFVCAQGVKLDPSFGEYGIVTAVNSLNPSYSRKILTLPDGSMYVIYFIGVIEKRHTDGSRDVSYGRRGFSVSMNMTPSDAAIQPDGKIVVGGSNENDFKITRFNTNGRLDSSFSDDGIQTTDFASNIDIAQTLAIQKDGKIVVAGYTSVAIISPVNGGTYYVKDFAIARYNKDGSPDNGFSGDGKLTTRFKTNSSINALAIQNDGKILAIGNTEDSFNQNPQFALARYNEDGSLDKTFSGDGKQTTDFGVNQIASASAVSIQEGGKIVVAGPAASSFLAIARYNTNGTLDSSFSVDGILIEKPFLEGNDTSIHVSSVAFQRDGQLVATFILIYFKERRHEEFALAKYNTDGSPDKGFSEDGKLTIARSAGNFYDPNSLAIQLDGKIVVAGNNSDDCSPFGGCPSYLFLSRFTIDGVPDYTFGNNGEVNGRQSNNTNTVQNYTSTAFQKDGKIIAVGTTVVGSGVKDYGDLNAFAVTRYNPEGTLDTTFSQDGIQTTRILANDFATSAAIQSDGRIVVVGSSRDAREYDEKTYFTITRYNSDGSLDTTFNGTGIITTSFNRDPDIVRSYASSVAIQSDGKIVVAGTDYPSDHENGNSDVTPDFAIIRFNTNGTPDSTFSEDGKLTTDLGGGNDNAFSVAIQSDGKLVVGGSFFVNGKYGLAVARYNKNGILDNSFGLAGTQTTYFDSTYSIIGNSSSLSIQDDGKILLAGSNNLPSGPKSMLVRYNTDGSLDNTFGDDGKQTTNLGYGSSIALESNGKIVVGGSDRISDLDFSLWRYDINGSIDSTFGNNGKQINNISDASDAISEIAINGNALYAAGTGQYPNSLGVLAKYLLDDKASTPPNVTLTSPANNITRLAPANIRLTAAASDADGSISKIEFYNDSHLLHTEKVTPYGFKWRDVPVGNYTITAKAYDNTGLVATSAPIHISVVPNKPPVVSIIKPVVKQTVAAPGYIHLEANATDVDGRVARVEFYNGSTLLRTEYEAPYTYVWKNVPKGTYTITAIAIDNWAARTASAPVTIRVVSQPVITANKPSAENDKADVNSAISINLAPNPANDIITITNTGLQRNKQLTLQVISSSGSVLKTIQSNSSTKTVQLDVSGLASGVYTIKIMNRAKVINKQFVKL